jgi:hypothetical protein
VCKDELLKWGELADELHQRHKSEPLTGVVESRGLKHVELLLRSSLRSNNHWDGVKKVALPSWLQDEASK